MSLPSWWSPKSDKRKQNKRSREQERRIARDNGGRVQPGSGSSWRAPQDVKTPDKLIEVKYTDMASYRLVKDDVVKLMRNAEAADREPELIIEFSTFGIAAIVHFKEI